MALGVYSVIAICRLDCCVIMSPVSINLGDKEQVLLQNIILYVL